MLAAAFMLGGLASVGLRYRRARVPAITGQAALARPGQGTYAGTAQPGQLRKKKRGILTNNAVVAGVVSAIVAGAISFAVAHYQTQDAARQALAGQQASAAVQLQTAANVYYQATFTVWGNCQQNPEGSCTDGTVSGTPFAIAQAAFNADRTNISDPRTSALAAQLVNLVGTAIDLSGDAHPGMYITQVVTVYQELINRCGQLIQGQQ